MSRLNHTPNKSRSWIKFLGCQENKIVLSAAKKFITTISALDANVLLVMHKELKGFLNLE